MNDPERLQFDLLEGELEDPQVDPDRIADPVAAFLDRRGLGWWRVWLIALMIYGLGEKILLPLALGYYNLGGPISSWRPDVEALVNGFLFAPAMFAAYRWQYDGTHRIFVQFARGDSFDDADAFSRFQTKAAISFARPWWIVSAVVAVVGVAVQHFLLWNPENPIPIEPWWTEGGATARTVALVLGAPLWFVIAQIVLGQIRLAASLRRLWSDLRGHYRLTSLGRSGGVRYLSSNIAVLTTIGAVVFLNIVLGILLPEMRDRQASPDFARWALLIWATYIVTVPGIAGYLLWPAHRVMLETKRKRISDIVAAIDRLLWKSEKDVTEQVELDSEEVEQLEHLHQLRDWLDEDLPTWPLPSPVRAISWSTMIPISLTILSLILQQP